MAAELPRVPLSVIGGYLGAGKTTLINQLLARHRHSRLAVLVNDFGSINIDAALLKSATRDTLELTNGCVCCTLSGDLFFALGDLLERRPRPDHILVEASGIADPASIANVALAEPELQYSGIVTVIDGLSISGQLEDQRIASQIEGQLHCADLLVMSKTEPGEGSAPQALRERGMQHWVSARELDVVTSCLFGSGHALPTPTDQRHPPYVQWSDPAPLPLGREEIVARLRELPEGLLRLKAIIPNGNEGFWEIHVVGRQCEVRVCIGPDRIGLTAIGLAGALTPTILRQWWIG